MRIESTLSKQLRYNNNLNFRTRILAGVISIIGLILAIFVGLIGINILASYIDTDIIALFLGMWIASRWYVTAWNEYCPWGINNED